MVKTITPAEVSFIGSGLDRPECVLPTSSGDIFTSYRHGVACVHADGRTTLVAAKSPPDDFLPNGIALLPDRRVLIANLGREGGVWRMDLAGNLTPELREVDGVQLPPTNFVGNDRAGRTWVTVSTRVYPRDNVLRKGWADGFIVMRNASSARIVAEGIGYTNEAIADPTGTHLYVNETMGRCISRFPIRPDGSLGTKEVVCAFGAGVFPDGFAFDANGDVWIVSVVSNRVIHVDVKTGKDTLVLEDCDAAAVAEAEHQYQTAVMERRCLDAGRLRQLGNIASIGFGGPDLRTVYLGSLYGPSIASFRSEIAGAEPVQWAY